MNPTRVLCLLLLTLSTFPALAEGAGGVEFSQVVGNDLWPFPGGSSLPTKTGLINMTTGLGYGVQQNGTVIGGFGMGITSKNLDLPDNPTGKPLKGFHAGYGGMLQGWQHSWGPLVILATTKIGFGGADWSQVEGAGNASDHTAGFSMLGSVDAEMGLILFPWFTLGVTGGVAGTITFVPGEPFLVGYAPTVGVRMLWGSF